MSRAVIAADLGAGSLRVAAITLDGTILAEASTVMDAATPLPDWFELDAEVWWKALAAGVGRVLDATPSALSVVAISITGMTRSHVVLGVDGEPLRPAFLWRDRRAQSDADALARDLPATNPAIAINPFHPLARLAWMRRVEPDLFARAAVALEPKDFLNFRLTGIAGTDVVVAGRIARFLGAEVPEQSRPLLRLLDIERRLPWTLLGPVTARAAPFDRLAGVPVVVGSMDTWSASVGSGAIRAGSAYDVAGTSEVAGLVTATPVAADGLVTVPWGPGLFHCGGPTQSGADAARWAYDTHRSDGGFEDALDRAGRRTPTTDCPIFLPYLLGERAPLWRADVRGAFFGLGRDTTADDFLWAAMEGVGHAIRDILSGALAAGGVAVEDVRVSGGGARSDAWCQIKADVLGVPLARPREVECGLLGATVAAGVATGAFATLADSADAINPVAAVFEPRRALRPFFEERARLYDRLKGFALAIADGEPPRAADSLRPRVPVAAPA